MNYKKYSYLVVLIFMLMIGINQVSAAYIWQSEWWDGVAKPSHVNDMKKDKIKSGTQTKECFYINPSNAGRDLRVAVRLFWGEFAVTNKDLRFGTTMAINRFGNKLSTTTTSMLNYGSDYMEGSNKDNIANVLPSDQYTTSGVALGFLYNMSQIKSMSDVACPRYVVIESDDAGSHEYFGWGTNSEQLAIQAANSSARKAEYAYASNFNENGEQITKEMYYSTFVVSGTDHIDASILSCEDIFTDDIKSLINEIMTYIRIIVPILIILLGTVDLAKAVIASKEDAIKKAQADLIKRVLIGVAVFFVPVLVDIVMYFGNIVWEGLGYTQCNFQ